MKMRHPITKQLVVHLVRTERLGKSVCYSGHVFEEAPPVLVCELVKFFVMPFQRDEGIAPEELVRVELANRSARLKEDEVSWLAEALADPTVLLQLTQGGI